MVQRCQMFANFLLGLVRVAAISHFMGRCLKSRVAEINPDSHLGPSRRIIGHERRIGKSFFQVLVDDRRFVDDRVTIDQDGNLGIGIQFEQVFGFVLEIDFDQIVGNLLFRQDNPSPVGIWSGDARIELHHRPPWLRVQSRESEFF